MMKKGFLVIFLTAVLVASITVAHVRLAASEEFPTKPIVMIVPWGAGGGSDTLSRTLAAIAPQYLGVQLVVKLRPGATGTIGLYEASKAKPDGYTMVINGQSATTTVPHSRKVPYDPINDFEFVCQIGEIPQGFCVYSERPWKSVDEVVKYAKENPGKLKIGHSGTGGLGHAQVLEFEKAAGIEVEDVPFKGTGPAVVAAGGGHIDAIIGSFASERPQIQAGNLRPLACSSAERDPLNPDIPTFRELGYDVVMTNLLCLSVPKGTPKERIDYLADAFHKTSEDKSWISLAKKLMIVPRWTGPDKAKDVVRDEYETVGELMKELRKGS
jgi:tripartite-type tricarboxylate transporter receptor subunit TctC